MNQTGGDHAQAKQPQLEADSFVDAHHHLWDLEACNYPWLMACGEERFFGDPTPIQQDYLPKHFLAESVRLKPLKSVHIQVGVGSGDEVAETAWLSNLGVFPHAIVAAGDLSSSLRDQWLEEQLQYPRFRGVRQILGRHREEDKKHNSDRLIDDPNFLAGLRRLAELGLSFDLQLIPEQMERVTALLRQVPELRVALCHGGSPWEQSGDGFAQWQRGLNKLAVLPNVFCKVSGLGMFNRNWQDRDLEPVITELIVSFGPERIMFGSNFPVDKLYASYDDVWSAYHRALASFPAHERHRMLVETASEFYRI